jgi:DNA primase
MKISDEDLKGVLLNPKLNTKGQYICDCPFCGKEKHFYISKSTQLWDCKKCGENGNVYKLLKFLDKTFLLAGRTIEDKSEIISIRGQKQADLAPEEVKVDKLPVLKLPVGFRVSVDDEYLLNRRLSKEEIKYYKIGGTALLRKYKDYVIMPVYDDGEIRGWVGRYRGAKVPDGVPRYKNSPGTNFSKLLYGYDEIIKGKTEIVILVEGIFDKIAVDRYLKLRWQDEIKCVCTFGKKISGEQVAKLVEKQVGRLVLLYDFDAISDIKRIGVELDKTFFTSITFTTKKDIDECTEDEALKVFEKFYKPYEFNENIIGKLKR